MKEYTKNLGKVVMTPKGAWSIEKEYEILDIVYDSVTDHAYISKQEVPSGVDLSDSRYWMPLNVSGYSDSNVITLNNFNEDGEIQSYTLEEAIKTIKGVGRKSGAILIFYNDNVNRLDITTGCWEIWQFNSINVYDWENLDAWLNVYYNYNKFVGWYAADNTLTKEIPNPDVGCYAFVGNIYNEAFVYRCDVKNQWTKTNQKAQHYIKVVFGDNVIIGDNGNWWQDGVDTNIPVSVKGDNGSTPYLRWSKNNQIEYSYDNINWHILSDKFNTNIKIKDYVRSVNELPNNVELGTIYGVGPVYTEDDIEQINPIYNLYVYTSNDWINNGIFKGFSAGVVQELGNSVTEVMSQDAVTKELIKLDHKNIYINGFGPNFNNIAGGVEIGQYYYNTNKNCIVKRIGEYSWEDIPLSSNTSYYHNGDLYIFDGEKLIKLIENVDTRLVAEELKSTILFSNLDKIQLETGTISVDDGIARDMTTRFRTKDFIAAPFSIDMNFGYCLNYLYKYDTNGLYIDWENLNSAPELEVNDSSYLYKVSFKRNDNADINNDDLKNPLTYRGKVGLLEKEVLNAKDILNSNTEDVYIPIPLHSEIKDSYLNIRGEVISAETGNFSIRIYDCKGISKIKLEGTGGGSACRYAFYYSDINPENVIMIGPQMSGELYSEILEVPNDAEFIAVSYRSSWEQSIFYVKKQVKGATDKKSIKILCFGNSFTLGSIGYAPFLLKDHFKEEIELTIGIAFISGGTLGPTWEGVENHLQKITEDTAYKYFKYVNGSNAWMSSSVNTSEILADEDWDVITFQQGSNNSPDYDTYQPYLNQCIDLISQKVSNPVKIAWLIPHADTKIFTQGKEQNILDSAEKVMDETITEVLIPYGTAIANARTTSLKEIGDAGNLLYEGKHLQNGLPMLVSNYCSIIVFLNLLGMNNKSIVGINSIEIDDDWVATHNIPHADAVGNCVGVTSENCRIAEKCAIMAIKKPYTIM